MYSPPVLNTLKANITAKPAHNPKNNTISATIQYTCLRRDFFSGGESVTSLSVHLYLSSGEFDDLTPVGELWVPPLFLGNVLPGLPACGVDIVNTSG